MKLRINLMNLKVMVLYFWGFLTCFLYLREIVLYSILASQRVCTLLVGMVSYIALIYELVGELGYGVLLLLLSFIKVLWRTESLQNTPYLYMP